MDGFCIGCELSTSRVCNPVLKGKEEEEKAYCALFVDKGAFPSLIQFGEIDIIFIYNWFDKLLAISPPHPSITQH